MARVLLDLDKLDQKILHHLDLRGDLTLSQLARSVRQGRDTVEYRVHRFVDRGVIRGFRAVINPLALGYILHKCYLRLTGDRRFREQFIKSIRKDRRVFWVSESNGEWDLTIALVAPSVQAVHSAERELLSPAYNLLSAHETYTVVRFWIHQIKYYGTSLPNGIPLEAVVTPPTLDEVDIEIIQNLARNARIPLNELADRVGVSAPTIRSRLDRLHQNQVIAGYATDIDLACLGLTQFKAQIFVNDIRPEEEQKFRQSCFLHRSVRAYMHQLGTCPLEIEIVVPSYADFVEALNQLKDDHPKFIRETKTLVLHGEHVNWAFLETHLS